MRLGEQISSLGEWQTQVMSRFVRPANHDWELPVVPVVERKNSERLARGWIYRHELKSKTKGSGQTR